MHLSKKAVLEIHELSRKAEQLARGTASERAQAQILSQRISTLRETGISSDEARELYASALIEETSGPKVEAEKRYRKAFDAYARGNQVEIRNFEAGQQTIFYTGGATGGYFVPTDYDPTVYEAFAQIGPVTDQDVVSLTIDEKGTISPTQISGYDLSSIAAIVIGEATLGQSGVIPSVAGGTLGSQHIFRANFGASVEAMLDVPDFTAKMIRAGAVALGRKLSRSILSGRGGVDISGITQNLSISFTNATAGKVQLDDLTNIFFGVDRFYRAAKKCSWLVSDNVYKMIRNAVDNSGRPLLSLEGDDELLLGKPIHICPELTSAYASIGMQGGILFGDLSHVVVRIARPSLRVSFESSEVDVTSGQAMFIFRTVGDALYFDPSGGSNAPIVMAAIS